MFMGPIFASGQAFQHNSVLPKKKKIVNNSYQNLKLSTFEIKFSPMSFITCKKTVRWCYYAVYYKTRVVGLVP